MDTGVVVAFPQSPALRETLAVLLEHDCQLHFLRPDAAHSDACLAASVAVVAVERPDTLVQSLRQHFPQLPIVAVELEGGWSEPMVPAPTVCRVPLEPHAIRSTVLQRLTPDGDASLRSATRLIGETLQAHLAYALTALRSFSALHASSAGPDTYALLGAVMREQSYVLAEAVDHLQRFQSRPRLADASPDFCLALTQQLQRVDSATDVWPFLCEVIGDQSSCTRGPAQLVPTVAPLLRAHLRRRADGPLVQMRLSSEGLRIAYRRRWSASKMRSWPLVLATLMLEPWSWSVSTAADGDQELVCLRRNE